jgi:hypothetical protein
MRTLWRYLIEIIGLQTARGRLLFFAVASIAIFLAPYSFLSRLSIWQHLGWDSAPSIGLTRAYWHLMHLDVSAAWVRNPLIFAVLLIGLPMLARDGYRTAKWLTRRRLSASS